MIILNGTKFENMNREEEFNKLSENCPNELYIQMITKMSCINFCEWKWMIKINGRFLDKNEIDKLPWFVEGIPYEEVVASFKINLFKVKNNINSIEIALNEIGKHYKNPSEKVDSFCFNVFDISDKNFVNLSKFIQINYDWRKTLYSKQISFCTFARVSDGWKFYPTMKDILSEHWCEIYPQF